MRLKSFPSSVGSAWMYEWDDRLHGKTDTVIVRVASALDSSALGPAKVWVFEHADGPDTLFMVEAGDTVRFLYRLEPDAWSTSFAFPLYVGAVWKPDPWKDSSRVSAQEVVSVPAGLFRRAFRVEERWGYTNIYGVVTTWIVPDVGIVMEDHWEFPFGPGPDYVRRLLAYEIVEYE